MSNKEDIKWRLQIIFVYYTSYADRNNFRLLKKQNYRRFLIDSETIKSESALVYFDIAFQKINHSAIIFKDFLKLLPEIAELVFKKASRAQAFNQYIRKHIQPLYNQIIQKSQFGQEVNIISTRQIDAKTFKKLSKIIVTQRAYNQYIATSMHNKQSFQVFESFTNFLKDFQICPQLVSKSVVYIIFLYLIKDNQGGLFTIDDFVKSLIIISEIGAKKISTMQLCSNGKMIKLLQRMEISAGFDKVSKKILYQTAISPSFLRSFCENYEQDNCLNSLQKNVSKMYPSASRHKNCNQSVQNEHQSGKKLKQAQTGSHQKQAATFSKEFKQIKLVFQQLCEFGEVANSKTLKSFKIKKLFQRIGVISLVGQAWLDIQIVNLQRSSQTGKIQLPQFFQLLSLTSQKINLPFEEIVNLLLNDQQAMSRVNENYHQNPPRKTYSEQEQQILKQIIQSCEKQLQKIYKKYSFDQLYLGFSQLTKMMYEFEIFPVIVSKSRLYQIFSMLNQIREETASTATRKSFKGKNSQNLFKDSKKMDFSGFLMGLIEVSQQICDDSLETVQKLIVLLQKINESEGYKKMSLISLVGEIRKKFVKYYVKSFQPAEEHVQDFDELLQNFA